MKLHLGAQTLTQPIQRASFAGAVTAVSQGDQDMAAAIQNKMGQASRSGDFTGLLPGS
ncbi:MAG: hypothetical protein LBI84_01320 [Propionibacteriaceae bacterium]|jgi:hypothetical protein|nr:hypothetical protein [Propionibacteriaceae bacterium]